jgi:hypothetical protein
MNAIDLQINLRKSEVIRLLGYPRRSKPSPRVALQLDRLWERRSQLIQPRGMTFLGTKNDAISVGMPRPTETVGFGLLTVGDRLERQSRQSDALEALIWDAIGSAAAEAAADALNARVCTAAGELGLTPASRISPGYGKWEIKYQKSFLGLFEASVLGITLTEGCMMIPQKSVSFAVRLDTDPDRIERTGRCQRCNLANCAYRRDDEAI